MTTSSKIVTEYQQRRRLMVSISNACKEIHPASSCLLQGIILQLDWQWQSGRWNPEQTGGSDWWQLANYTLTAWVAEVALESGIVAKNGSDPETDCSLAVPNHVAAAWRRYFEALLACRDDASSVHQDQLTKLYWIAHDSCLDEITGRFSDQLDQLPPKEKKFANAWVSLVRVLAKIRFNPGIVILEQLQKLLPTAILDEQGWASTGLFTRNFVRLLSRSQRLLGVIAAV